MMVWLILRDVVDVVDVVMNGKVVVVNTKMVVVKKMVVVVNKRVVVVNDSRHPLPTCYSLLPKVEQVIDWRSILHYPPSNNLLLWIVDRRTWRLLKLLWMMFWNQEKIFLDFDIVVLEPDVNVFYCRSEEVDALALQ